MVRIERFGDPAQGASTSGFTEPLDSSFAGQNEAGHLEAAFENRGEQLHTAHSRHVDVRDQQRNRCGFDDFQRLEPIGRLSQLQSQST